MADREKVIKGLECCGKGNMCRNHCPYDGPENDIKNCTSQLARDALSLLKAQEPRVMTLDEAISAYIGVAYYESLYSSIVLAGYMYSVRNGRCEFATVGSEETEKEMLSDYGIKWRCWTSPPTDEQREVTPWN